MPARAQTPGPVRVFDRDAAAGATPAAPPRAGRDPAASCGRIPGRDDEREQILTRAAHDQIDVRTQRARRDEPPRRRESRTQSAAPDTERRSDERLEHVPFSTMSIRSSSPRISPLSSAIRISALVVEVALSAFSDRDEPARLEQRLPRLEVQRLGVGEHAVEIEDGSLLTSLRRSRVRATIVPRGAQLLARANRDFQPARGRIRQS